MAEDLRKMVESLPQGLRSIRNRAMLVLGSAGAFRRSELVALNIEDLRFVDEGLEVLVRRSKTDQEGRGRTVAIPYGSQLFTCPVRSVQAWLDVLGASEGPLFRQISADGIREHRASDGAVDRLVKASARQIGLNGVSAHSLRAGLATTAYLSGKSDRAIQEQGRWVSIASVNRYVRDARVWKEENAAAGIGL